jgi:hypothetical protein
MGGDPCHGVSESIIFAGVSHVMRSTPEVRLPWFSVTRFTAKALAENEWVSSCCKACTLPHLLSCTAFTIRAWSRRTLRCTVGQSMACQSTVAWETAPAVASAVICFVSSVGWPCSLVMKDQREVSSLSRGVMLPRLNPYPPHYRTTFACSLPLYPPCDGLA